MIYILLLESNKYYVGYTDRPIKERLAEHVDGDGARWTQVYPPVKVLYVDEDDEDELTLRMMDLLGWQSVRGGRWCQVGMKYPPRALRNQYFDHDACIRCDRTNHDVTECRAKYHDDGYYLEPLPSLSYCRRCGRDNHKTADCFAKTHITGYWLDSESESESESEYESEVDSDCCPCCKRIRCIRCLRTGHTERECWSVYHADGSLLDIECSRCGRKNNNYYVGLTSRSVPERIRRHLGGSGAEWTKLHKPLRLLHITTGDAKTEDEITIKMMMEFGMDHVRGGRWTQRQLNPRYIPNSVKQSQQDVMVVECIRCGRSTHSILNCDATRHQHGHALEPLPECLMDYVKSTGYSTRRRSYNSKRANVSCRRCGRNNHSQENCFAKRHLNGHFLGHHTAGVGENSNRHDTIDNSNSHATTDGIAGTPHDEHSLDDNGSDSEGFYCTRCGRNNHFTKDCIASTHRDGHILDDTDSDSEGLYCTRCGRNNHFTKDCVASTHHDGYLLDDTDSEGLYCTRCGRSNHFTKDCIARVHHDGHYLDDSDSDSEGLYCTRCGRNNHFTKDCIASTHHDGHLLHGETNELLCTRCGRSNHFTKDCVARVHINGRYLTNPVEESKEHCARCGRCNHQTRDCVARVHIQGHYL